LNQAPARDVYYYHRRYAKYYKMPYDYSSADTAQPPDGSALHKK